MKTVHSSCRLLQRRKHKSLHQPGQSHRCRLLLQELESRLVPATITVTGTANSVSPDGICTLREAIQSLNNGASANADVAANVTGSYGSADAIVFSNLFNSAQIIDFSGQISIAKSMTITGKGASLLTLHNAAGASSTSRLFEMAAIGTATITLQDMTLTGGNLTVGADGGAILNADEDVRLTNVTVTGNKTAGSGGAIAMTAFMGKLTLTGCTLTGNSAGGNGGVVNIASPVTITVDSTTISGNTASIYGGVFHIPEGADCSIKVNSSTFDTNTATGVSGKLLGGAVFYVAEASTISLTKSAFSNNSSFGGGTVVDIGAGACSITVDSCTFTGNAGARGCFQAGAINFVSGPNSAGTQIEIKASDFTGNSAASGAAVSFSKSGTLLIDRCQFTGNTIQGVGGVIRGSSETFTFSLTNSSFTGNTADGSGGALYLGAGSASGIQVISNSTFASNLSSTGSGGAIFIGGTASYSIDNSTFSGNTASGNASSGGGAINISSIAKVAINNSTIVDNVAYGASGIGGGIRRGSSSTIGTTTIISSIVANNTDLYGFPTDMWFPVAVTINGGANLVGAADVGNFTLDATSGINFVGDTTTPLDPQLAPLADNGGATIPHTLTRMPATTSAAVGHGNQNGLFVDQAGYGRPSVGTDVGAVQGIYDKPTAVATMPATVTTPGGTTYIVTVVYTDETGINTTTLNAGDLTISGPGYPTPANPNGAPIITGPVGSVTVTYTFDAAPSPGGSWDNSDNGTYTVTLNDNQVADTDTPVFKYVVGGTIGTFKVAIPTTYQVDALGDVDDGNYSAGQQTLREAIKRANNDVGTRDTITFSAAINGAPILIASELAVTDSVSIIGNGADQTIVDGGLTTRVFNLNVTGTGDVSISGVKITGGASGAGRGAGILSANENVTLDAVWIDSNQTTSGSGAGIGFTSAGKLIIQNSTISGNYADSGSGAGIYIPGGPATYLLVRNSTISNNIAFSSVGGGIRIGTGTGGSVVKLWNSSVANNSSGGSGGGLSATTVPNAITVNIESSIVAANQAGSSTGNDIVGPTILALNSFIGSGNDGHTLNAQGTTIAGTNATPADPMLGSLANNGGAMPTLLPAVGSPVHDIGSNPAPALTLDQRGQARNQQFGVDIGSVESVDPTPKATLTPIASITMSGTAPDTVVVTFKDSIGIDYTTIKSSNITILDPNSVPIAILSALPDALTNGQIRVATYKFAIPGGSWDSTDNGVYTIQMNGSEVFDIDSTPISVAANPTFGTFRVAVGKSIVVDEATDDDNGLYGPGQLSIREAVGFANQDPYSLDTITFGGAAFAGAVTIPMAVGEIAIAGSVSILGTGAAKLAFNGQLATRFFNIDDPTHASSVLISDMTLTNAASSGAGGAILLTSDHLTLSNCVITNNSAGDFGGAVGIIGSYASGSALVMNRVQMSGNSAATTGGGIESGSGGALVQITDSTLSGNSAGIRGGGFGGSNLPSGSMFQNCTISDNWANTQGGGLSLVNGSQSFLNCTITNNFANDVGGGFHLSNNSLSMVLVLDNTIVANNVSGSEYDFSVLTKTTVNGDHNLIGVAEDPEVIYPGTSNLYGTVGSPLDPLLGPLQDNGGPTLTRALLEGSPAVNGGDTTTPLTYDQRGNGFARKIGTKVDIGAYEVQLLAPTVTAVVFGDGTNQRSMVKQIVVTFSEPVTFMGSVASAFTLHRTGTAGTIGDVDLTANPAAGPASSVTITFAGALAQFGSLVDGFYDLTISAAQISGIGGALDGNNDNVPGGSYIVQGNTTNKFFRLYGDANGNGVTDLSDFAAFRNAFNLGPSTIFDFGEGDNNVGLADFAQFRGRFNLTP